MEKSQSSSTFALTVAVIVAVCGGLAALGLRHRRDEEAALAGVVIAPPPEPPPPLPPPPPPPELLTDPTAEPTQTLRGKITFDASERMVVHDDATESTAVFSRAQLEEQILRFHRDDQAKAYWLDLTDGRRVELDPASAATLAQTLPNRFTYGASRAGDEKYPE